MMPVDIIPKQSAQKLQQFPILPRRTIIQPTVWYTCPVGKKAVVAGTAQSTGLGAAGTGDLDVGGITKFRWVTGAPSSIIDNCRPAPNQLRVVLRERCPFRIELAAGEIVETNQSVGTNAEFNLDLEVFETDA